MRRREGTAEKFGVVFHYLLIDMLTLQVNAKGTHDSLARAGIQNTRELRFQPRCPPASMRNRGGGEALERLFGTAGGWGIRPSVFLESLSIKAFCALVAGESGHGRRRE